MNLISGSSNPHLLRLSPTVRMCVKGLLIGSVISSIRPEEEDLFYCWNPADTFKISILTTETFSLMLYNRDGRLDTRLPIFSMVVTYIGLRATTAYIRAYTGPNTEINMNTTIKIVTLFLKIILLANIGIMLVKEGGLIPIVALTSYLFTSIVQDANIVPYKVAALFYNIVENRFLPFVCNFLIYDGKTQTFWWQWIAVYFTTRLGSLGYL